MQILVSHQHHAYGHAAMATQYDTRSLCRCASSSADGMGLCNAADFNTYVDDIADAWLAEDAADLACVDDGDGIGGEQRALESPTAGGGDSSNLACSAGWCGTNPSTATPAARLIGIRSASVCTAGPRIGTATNAPRTQPTPGNRTIHTSSLLLAITQLRG